MPRFSGHFSDLIHTARGLCLLAFLLGTELAIKEIKEDRKMKHTGHPATCEKCINSNLDVRDAEAAHYAVVKPKPNLKGHTNDAHRMAHS